jgi:ATP-dependent Clp protease ATP-binding subunit ClpB
MNGKNKQEVFAKTKVEVNQLLRQTIRPEFLNRIDEIIMFAPLDVNEVKKIVKLQFGEVVKRLAKEKVRLSASKEAIDWMTEQGYDPQFGARPIKRVMQRTILNELSKSMLAGELWQDTNVLLDVSDNKIVQQIIQ